MARTPTALLSIGLFALLLSAALAPLAVAQGPGHASRLGRMHQPMQAPGHRGAAFDLHLNGTATAKDGHVYRFELDGQGRARPHHGGNATGAGGLAKVHVRVLDAGGAVVREGDLHAMMKVRKTATGMEWHLVAVGKHEKHAPHIVLKGTGLPDGVGFALQGTGKAVAKTDAASKASVLSLTVAGTLSRTARVA